MSVKPQDYYEEFAHDEQHHVGLEGVVQATGVGYSEDAVRNVPEGSDRGLSSGNPFNGLSIEPGSCVIDLGCGAGRDCFIAASMVGDGGRVIGIDATEAMVCEARAIAEREGIANVEFNQGEVLCIPLPDSCADYVLSNCVFNMVDDKLTAFAEVHRILKEGGLFSFSDVMTTSEASPRLAKSKTACLARAVNVDVYVDALEQAGFSEVLVASQRPWPTYRGVVSTQLIVRA